MRNDKVTIIGRGKCKCGHDLKWKIMQLDYEEDSSNKGFIFLQEICTNSNNKCNHSLVFSMDIEKVISEL